MIYNNLKPINLIHAKIMITPKFTSFFLFTRTQRIGIVVLFTIIVTGQTFIYLTSTANNPEPSTSKHLASFQREIDSLKTIVPPPRKIYPFNPNFITDFKGYRMGMSVQEIDRLLAFRQKNLYANSAAEFQQITGISDSLLAVMSPYFKFPDWVNQKKRARYSGKAPYETVVKIKQIDINAASAEDLIAVYGIGAALSERILKQKLLLGGFVTMEQMQDVWGLSPEVVDNLKKHFVVNAVPSVKKVNINTASLKELSQFPYFRYPLSKAIVTYRSMQGNIESAADLAKIPSFPVEKIDRIAIYLEF